MVPVILGPEQRPLSDRPPPSRARACIDEGVEERVRDRRRRPAQARYRHLLEHDGLSRLDPSVRRQGAPPRLCGSAEDRDAHGRTIPIARWRENCATTAASPRIRRLFRNSSGPTSCACASSRRRSNRISTPPWRPRLVLAKSLDANYLPGWCAPHAKPIASAKPKKKPRH